MGDMSKLVIFKIEDQRFALYLSTVERVFRVVEINPLPKAPKCILGIINYHGQIVPVADLRIQFRFPEREIELSDQIIIAHSSKRPIALLVDSVGDIIERKTAEITKAKNIFVGIQYIEGVLKLDDGIVLLHDLEKFLSEEEGVSLERALQGINAEKQKQTLIRQKQKINKR